MAQPLDVGAHDFWVGFAVAASGPDLAQQVLVGQDPARALREHAQQLVLGRRQRHRAPGHADPAQAYADEYGVSFERAMKKIPHVSKRTAWDDVTAEYEELRRETEMQRADLMALENARLDQVFSKALSLFANGRVPAGRLAIATMGRRCLFVAGSLPVRVPQRAGVEVRAPNAPAPTIRKSVLLKNTASLALLRFFAAQGGEPAPASRFRSGT